MITLSFGFKKPEINDKGDVVFPALEDNIQQLNDHTHNGTDSAKLTAGSFDPLTETLSNVNWVLATNDLYRQLVTLPASLSFDLVVIQCRLSDGSLFYPTLERVSVSQFYIYINDNTQNVTVQYV